MKICSNAVRQNAERPENRRKPVGFASSSIPLTATQFGCPEKSRCRRTFEWKTYIFMIFFLCVCVCIKLNNRRCIQLQSDKWHQWDSPSFSGSNKNNQCCNFSWHNKTTFYPPLAGDDRVDTEGYDAASGNWRKEVFDVGLKWKRILKKRSKRVKNSSALL